MPHRSDWLRWTSEAESGMAGLTLWNTSLQRIWTTKQSLTTFPPAAPLGFITGQEARCCFDKCIGSLTLAMREKLTH